MEVIVMFNKKTKPIKKIREKSEIEKQIEIEILSDLEQLSDDDPTKYTGAAFKFRLKKN